MELEEREGVDPVIERRCTECGVELTQREIQAALDSGGPYLCTMHANEQVALDDEGDPSA
jgi:hypothetical protein